MVAVSAARVKVVAVGAPPAWALHLDPLRCDGGLAAVRKGGGVVGEAMGPSGPEGPYGTSTAWRPSMATPPER
ncbi:hypothetical protein GCM10028793_26560 [Nocardiopsis oceani]